jgi:hypothetical protein
MTNLMTTRRAATFQAPGPERMALESGAICRVWFRKRSGIPQSFRDIGNFHVAANFAAFIVADRIEVVRESVMPVGYA